MAKLKLKSLLTEAKNSPEEKGLKSLAKSPWQYTWDYGADHGELDNGNEVFIFPPYDVVKDHEGMFASGEAGKAKGNWMVQVGSADGRTNKFFWYKTLPQALKAIKTEHMPKFAKYKSR